MAVLLSGCGDRPLPAGSAGSLCLADTTSITDIQGGGWYSPLEGTRQSVKGVVTAIDPGRGFYLEATSRGRHGHSSALFIAGRDLAGRASPGQEWAIDGYVEETGDRRDKMTSLVRHEAYTVCSERLQLPLARVALPLDNRGREALEGMRVSFAQNLHVTDVYSQYRGKLTLSSGGPLRVPTEDQAPGRAAEQMERQNRERAVTVALPGERSQPLAVGSRIIELTGVLGHDGRNQFLLADNAGSEPAGAAPVIDPPAPGRLRAVNANLLNFFNGDGRGAGFPTERGAETAADFREQQARTRAALVKLTPDLLAVQELENDGFGPYSAAASLLELLDDTGAGPYAVVRPAGRRIGGDVITVGLFYREAALETVGPAHLLDTEPFRDLSRQPLAQLFRERATGTLFLAAVTHLKSKGGCPDDRQDENSDRGQGCWNRARSAAVEHLLPWLEDLADSAGTDRILVLGDMNAYRREDPVRAFRAGGYVELVEERSGLPQYSHRYFGQAGTLDYIFASAPLARHASHAEIWHINADWPRNMALPQPWLRMSDHDPVVVDFDFSGRP